MRCCAAATTVMAHDRGALLTRVTPVSHATVYANRVDPARRGGWPLGASINDVNETRSAARVSTSYVSHRWHP